MFTGIKDKLLNVKLFGNVDSNDARSKSSRQTFNLCAGAGILQRFEDQWQEVHELNEENARAAQEAAEEIRTIARHVDKSKLNIDLISHLLTSSNLTGNISQCLTQVKELYSACESIEQKLLDLEILLDDVEFDGMVKQHKHHLENYKTRKQENLNNIKETLQGEYDKRLVEHESSKKLILEERQKVFQEAFKNDLEVYKSLGTIPKVDLPKNRNGAILEEIQLDFDQNELEQFFNDDDNKET